MIGRRQFITLLGGAATWPLAASAQQRAMPVIGFLGSGFSKTSAQLVATFRLGLEETGYSEGRNVAIEYRWAEGHYDRIPALIGDLVQRNVAVIVASGGVHGALAAKAATSIIPIVFANGSDPIKFGLVASLNRPGGNVTGVSFFTADLDAKRLELLRQLVPQVTAIAALLNPTNANAENQSKALKEAARTLGLQVDVHNASNERDFNAAFLAIAQKHAAALLIASDPLFFNLREKLVTLAARHAVPAMY